jgi:hypothetical protein
MTEVAERPTNELLEHLPPVDKSPILQTLARVGYETFQREYLLKTPITDEGLVDHEALINLMRDQVDSDYHWAAPFHDEHHLNWYASLYEAPSHSNPQLAHEFRELPVNKLWVPRQFHNFIHTVTAPSPVPSNEVMHQQIKDFRRRSFIYRTATRAIEIQEKIERSEIKVGPNGEMMWIDSKTHRTYHDPDILEERRENFVRQILKQYRRGLIDLSELAPVEMVDVDTLEASLPEVISIVMNEDRFNNENHKSLRVDLPVNRPAHRGVNVA